MKVKRRKGKFPMLWLKAIELNKPIKQVYWEHESGIDHIYKV